MTKTLPVPPPLGHPIPYSRHAVSVQLPTWLDMCDMAHGSSRVKSVQKIGYPRSFIQSDVQALMDICVKRYAVGDQACLLFPTPDHAAACKRFMESKGDISPDVIHTIDVCAPGRGGLLGIHAAIFSTTYFPVGLQFWRLSGTGISSRLAEDLLEDNNAFGNGRVDLCQNRSLMLHDAGRLAQEAIRDRIVSLVNRTRPPGGGPVSEPRSSDVFLYPTGMSAIYHCNRFLDQWRGAKSIVFGFPYELTLKLVETFGESCKFYGFGTPKELDELEADLASWAKQGEPIQAIWCECPSNPLLRTVDLDRIRELGDHYGIPIIVDETIGSFANVDVRGVADLIITSLTKSFSGYLDVMGGSVILNPSSKFYSTFKKLFSTYPNELYPRDAIQLEYNSRDFLPRAAKMNETAMHLVSSLYHHVSDPGSILTNIYYPAVCWSIKNYRARLRPDTVDFTPGYGCLFTLEFASVESASRFFDALQVHKGPSLGGNLTLAQPYVQTVFFREKHWAARYGLKESIVRISVGLESVHDLLETFQHAIQVAGCRKDEFV
ncbi:pyridoxal phosphate-dependent transferase [Aspergillus varians]